MCGKHWGYKSFVFVSAVTKGLTGDYFVSAAMIGLSRNSKLETRKKAKLGELGHNVPILH
jgi:hypothetical protein